MTVTDVDGASSTITVIVDNDVPGLDITYNEPEASLSEKPGFSVDFTMSGEDFAKKHASD